MDLSLLVERYVSDLCQPAKRAKGDQRRDAGWGEVLDGDLERLGFPGSVELNMITDINKLMRLEKFVKLQQRLCQKTHECLCLIPIGGKLEQFTKLKA